MNDLHRPPNAFGQNCTRESSREVKRFEKHLKLFYQQDNERIMNNMRVSVLLLQDVLNDECLFKERLKKNGFHTFSSYKYSGLNSGNAVGEWYLAIKKNGKFKLAVNTDQSQHSTHFTVIPVNINR